MPTEPIFLKNRFNLSAQHRQNPASSVGYELVIPEVLPPKNSWSDFLPLLGKEARAAGYLLPLPFGMFTA